MRRLIVFALVCAAAWYGWKNYARYKPADFHEVVIVNHSGYVLQRLRISGGGETLVVETLANGTTLARPLRAGPDGEFSVVWKSTRHAGDREWKGGRVSAAPELMTHRFEFDGEDRVKWSSAKKPAR